MCCDCARSSRRRSSRCRHCANAVSPTNSRGRGRTCCPLDVAFDNTRRIYFTFLFFLHTSARTLFSLYVRTYDVTAAHIPMCVRTYIGLAAHEHHHHRPPTVFARALYPTRRPTLRTFLQSKNHITPPPPPPPILSYPSPPPPPKPRTRSRSRVPRSSFFFFTVRVLVVSIVICFCFFSFVFFYFFPPGWFNERNYGG